MNPRLSVVIFVCLVVAAIITGNYYPLAGVVAGLLVIVLTERFRNSRG